MDKKWKIIFFSLILLLAYSFFDISRNLVQVDLISSILSPYKVYDNPHEVITLISAENVDQTKNNLIKIADSNNVNFTIVVSGSNTNETEYYWHITESKFLFPNSVLNKPITIQKFNSLEQPVTEKSDSEYFFDLPLSTYHYKILPFTKFSNSNLSVDITVFSENKDSIENFLTALGKNGIKYTPFNLTAEKNTSPLQNLKFVLEQNPVAPLSIGLYFLVLFAILYSDRRNLSIKLINGYSKTEYYMEFIKKIASYLLLMGSISFAVLYLSTIGLNISHLGGILSRFVPFTLVLMVLTALLSYIFVFSFTDITRESYIKGTSRKTALPIFFSLTKFLVTILICILAIPAVNNIVGSLTVYNSLSERSKLYPHAYTIDTRSNYLKTLIVKNDEIVDELLKFKGSYVISGYEIKDEIAVDTKFKVFNANRNYIEKYIKFDINGNPIDPSRMDVIYTQTRNKDGVEELKQYNGFLCDSTGNCLNSETILLPDDFEIPTYYMDPLNTKANYKNDFVLFPKESNLSIFQFVLNFENESEIQNLKSNLAGIVDINEFNFIKMTDVFEEHLDIYKNSVVKYLTQILNYVVIVAILSVITYLIKFEKVKREFSIYWVNGISKFKHFYNDYISFILLNILALIIVKEFAYPEITSNLTLLLGLILIAIDTVTLMIFRFIFYNKIHQNIKEHT